MQQKNGQVNKGEEILVYAHWMGMRDPVLIGTLWSYPSREKELFRFQYDEGWLKNQPTHYLDPYLQFYSGSFFPRGEADNFGMFLDSSPGDWGRLLMQQRENANAKREKREVRMLHESDFLLGVFDYYRSGALRFKTSIDGDFVTSDEQFILPSLSSLRELEHASMLCSSGDFNSKELQLSIDTLTASGAALGGKRPKASVIDNDWQMWIAKFPDVNDEIDVGGWEFIAHTMAGIAGIQTAPGVIRKLNSHHHTFISHRFDRTLKGERIHFASAMTLLGYSDRDVRTRRSYLDLAEFIMRHGADVNSDLEELWRRIVFNIAIRNTDDRLDNHGFLLTNEGWKLSPAFDLNPDVRGGGLSLNISEHLNSLDFDLALSVAELFRVKQERAKSIVMEIKIVAGQWRKLAADAGILKSEQEKMSAAFEGN